MVDLLVVGADGAAVAVGLDANLLAAADDTAAIRRFQEVDAPEERAFARSGTADDRDDVTVAGLQRDPLQDFERTERLMGTSKNAFARSRWHCCCTPAS